MLPFFTTLPSVTLENLQKALEALVAAHFPMQSDEFPRGSLQRNNYMDCVHKVKGCKVAMGQKGFHSFISFIHDIVLT